jgi:hypothetical protein
MFAFKYILGIEYFFSNTILSKIGLQMYLKEIKVSSHGNVQQTSFSKDPSSLFIYWK